ncbi:hypothetical protein VP01_1615g2 [Puccinia sorghi]|uniref:Uncharacterized protein n=1 Tax=Puccinia sorghi TaxID=27349 RepID=A0A0L6VIX3_9BASI|nr:hypothetical protein VP01_1615g2 [Puccinia sorghi]
MQKVLGSFCFYFNHSPKVIQPSFDAQSLCILHSDCAKTSTHANSAFSQLIELSPVYAEEIVKSLSKKLADPSKSNVSYINKPEEIPKSKSSMLLSREHIRKYPMCFYSFDIQTKVLDKERMHNLKSSKLQEIYEEQGSEAGLVMLLKQTFFLFRIHNLIMRG